MKIPVGKAYFTLPGLLLVLAVLLTAAWMAYGLTTPSSLAEGNELPRIGTYDNLMQLLSNAENQNGVLHDRMALKSEAVAVPQAAGTGSAENTDPSYSTTNIQVEGVDEADLVKADGTYIYQVNGGKVLIVKAVPPEKMAVAASIQFEDKAFNPLELYVDGNTLIVIGSCYQQIQSGAVSSKIRSEIYPPIRSFQSTRAIIYNIADKTNIIKTRDLELEGSYLSSRKVGSSFYLLANKYINYYSIQNGEDSVTPSWRDSARGGSLISEKLGDICYFPDCISPNYLMVAALDVNSPGSPADIHTYLGSGDQVYASQDNLYVAIQKNDDPVAASPRVSMVYQPPTYSTSIYKFELQPGKVLYDGTGSVPGRILNQFSMDESKGYFRIATTSGETWTNDQYTSSNNIYVLDQNLQVCGKIENIAPGERIYSTRFMGDRAYMVTFQQVDPFFVLDLKDPANPVILGKLKIPGYSDYLQPYDENHIIGFGKDTVVTKEGNSQGQAFYQGMKIALFDVTDVNNPVEMSKVLIGDRGTDSELLNNHKALLFSADKNLIAFPVTVMETDSQSGSQLSGIPAYGTFTFQGLYVYHIDLTNGLQYRGRISHFSDEEYLKAGDIGYNTDKNVERGLYIGDTLYSLSQAMIKANSISDLSEISSLNLPHTPSNGYLIK
jgi:Secreted protein containing C-terminal beta-propeller domain distantly related to WD-40 repeats